MNKNKLINLSSTQILDFMNDGVYVTDRERNILYWNNAAERMIGWTSDEIVGRSCFDNLLCHEDKDGHQLCGKEYCPLHRAMITNSSSTVPIIVFAQCKDGTQIPLQVSVAPITDESGVVIGGVETFRDLSLLMKDLKRAKNIQKQSLRLPEDNDPRVTFTVHYVPFDVVGGDYYTIEKLDDHRYVFMLADVMGHGIPAALYTMHLHGLWTECRHLFAAPAKFMAEANRKLCNLAEDGDTFATAVFGLIDLDRRQVCFSNAASPPLIVSRKDGALESFESPGFPLGLMKNMDYEETTISLHPGDSLLCFTDGAVEVRDAEHHELGLSGFMALLKKIGYPDSKSEMEKIEEKLLQYSNSIRFEDDLTMLSIKLTE
ncbi:MAG: SpoIIE family protein phosphatase [Deltaproteobacteria bacterium]|nr:SpoIIE family protein phosphatase [Candidatus Tharpellaceae bacterium]